MLSRTHSHIFIAVGDAYVVKNHIFGSFMMKDVNRGAVSLILSVVCVALVSSQSLQIHLPTSSLRSSSSQFDLYLLKDGADRGAVCNDGTPGGFYFRRGQQADKYGCWNVRVCMPCGKGNNIRLYEVRLREEARKMTETGHFERR